MSRLMVLEKKVEMGMQMRVLNARLGEREMLNSPGVRVLGLKGGRMRGVGTLLVLEELDKRTGVKTNQTFDLIVRTSTGAIIASLMGISCMEARDGVGGLVQNHFFIINHLVGPQGCALDQN